MIKHPNEIAADWFLNASLKFAPRINLPNADSLIKNTFGVSPEAVRLKSIWLLGVPERTPNLGGVHTLYESVHSYILNKSPVFKSEYISGTYGDEVHNAFYKYKGDPVNQPNCLLQYSNNAWGLTTAFSGLVLITPISNKSRANQDYIDYIRAVIPTLIANQCWLIVLYNSSDPSTDLTQVCLDFGLEYDNGVFFCRNESLDVKAFDISESSFYYNLDATLSEHLKDLHIYADLDDYDIRFLDTLVAVPDFETYTSSKRVRGRFHHKVCPFISQAPISVELVRTITIELGLRLKENLSDKTLFHLANKVINLLHSIEYTFKKDDPEANDCYSTPKSLRLKSLEPYFTSYGVDLNRLISDPTYQPETTNLPRLLLEVFFDIVASYAELCNALSLLTDQNMAYLVDWDRKRISLIGNGYRLLTSTELLLLRSGVLTQVAHFSKSRVSVEALNSASYGNVAFGDSAEANLFQYPTNVAEINSVDYPKKAMIGSQPPNALGFYNISRGTNTLVLTGVQDLSSKHQGRQSVYNQALRLQRGTKPIDLPSIAYLDAIDTQKEVVPLLTPTQCVLSKEKEQPFEATREWFVLHLKSGVFSERSEVEALDQLNKLLGCSASEPLIGALDCSWSNHAGVLKVLDIFNTHLSSMSFFLCLERSK